ncbi:MAG: Leu/Phe/Val dehydrogenase [Pseudomonadota bacterium]
MFDRLERERLEDLHLRRDPASGLQAIIAIHNTRLGPALGGCRFIEYTSDDAAITDAIRLARGMSYKAALANVPQGGGKAVIIRPPLIRDRGALYRAFGRFVNNLGGRYITAVDSGTTLADMDEVAGVTPHVSGTGQDGADPSPVTALGVFSGLQAAVRHQLGTDSLKGLRVAIQGGGNVGHSLARHLHEAGARLVISDPDPSRTQRCQDAFQAEVVEPDAIYDQACDAFAPCGLGGILNGQTIPRLQCRIVAGAANNQLADDAQGDALHRAGILYAPDYVINAGGLIQVSLSHHRAPETEVLHRTRALGDTLGELFERSRLEDRPPEQIANQRAEEILYGQG